MYICYVSTQVRIGVRKTQSYVSFLREPHTRFKVKSMVGDTNSQINISKMSSIIISKMKAAIKSKLVYPKVTHHPLRQAIQPYSSQHAATHATQMPSDYYTA